MGNGRPVAQPRNGAKENARGQGTSKEKAVSPRSRAHSSRWFSHGSRHGLWAFALTGWRATAPRLSTFMSRTRMASAGHSAGKRSLRVDGDEVRVMSGDGHIDIQLAAAG